MNSDKFDQKIKSKLENFEATPPKGSFDAIQQKLNQKNSEKIVLVLPLFVKYGLTASLAFLLGIGFVKYYGDTNEPSEANYVSATNENLKESETEELISLNEPNAIRNGKNGVTINSIVSNEQDKSANTNAISTAVKTQTNSSVVSNINEKVNNFLANSETINKVDYENVTTYSLYNLYSQLNDGTYIVELDEDPAFSRFMSKKNEMGYKGFWFGPEISYESKFIAGKAFMGSGFGIDYGFGINERIGLQSAFTYSMNSKDFKLNNSDNQSYYELVNFSSVNIPLSIKFKHSYFASNLERPVSFNTYFGGNYSYFHEIQKNQLGVHAGLEYDVFLKQEMYLTFGVRAGLNSLMNYTPAQSYLSENYRKVNYSLGVYSSIRFLSRKNTSY